MNELYKRQKDLELDVPKEVTVIGVGGVGSWVALNLALTGVEVVYIIDPDTIEKGNLNRTPYKEEHIGNYKVEAMTELIAERRNDTRIVSYIDKVENLDNDIIDLIKDTEILDCRDNTDILPSGMSKTIKVMGGYDGFNVSLHTNPKPSSIWGDEPARYTITPSFLVPPQMIANFITLYISTDLKKDSKEKIRNIDVREMYKRIINKPKEDKKLKKQIKKIYKIYDEDTAKPPVWLHSKIKRLIE